MQHESGHAAVDQSQFTEVDVAEVVRLLFMEEGMEWTRSVVTRQERIRRQASFRVLMHWTLNLIFVIEIAKLICDRW